MKKIVWSVVLLIALFHQSCTDSQQTASATTPEVVAATEAPVMKFAETSYDFGSIQEGEVVTHTFAFTNTGKTPLVIERAFASCGCTVPDWPRKPVAPGASGEIKLNSIAVARQVRSKRPLLSTPTPNRENRL
jgi:hypothetical protein